MKTSASSRRGSFREIEHTADLGIEVTAADLPALFALAGEAVFSLIVDPQTVESREISAVSATGSCPEDLLHAWLRELLARFNIDGFVARSCEITRLDPGQIDGIITGETLDLSRHTFHTEIKGVTYHDFKVWQEDGAWHARIIFDV
jgi:SHS2 domain-containing protein